MIHRSKHSQNYTVMPNAIFKEITDGLAIGILSYLLSKPENWTVTKQQLYRHFDEGRQRIDKAFKILESTGYIRGEQQKDKGSKFQGYNWIVSDIPDTRQTENRLTENRQTEIQLTDTDQLISNIVLSTEPNKESNKKGVDLDFDLLLKFFNKLFKKSSRIVNKYVRDKYSSRIKEGFTKEDIKLAMENAHSDTYHQETNYKHCTLEFFSRPDKLDKFSSMGRQAKQSTVYTPTT